MRPEWLGSRGITLSELLVALALVGLVVAALAGLFQQGVEAYLAGAAQVEAQQSARAAMERLARELLSAGLDPTGAGFPALIGPSPTAFTIQNDLNGDGVIAGNPESVTYSLTGRTLRRNAGGGAQPVIEGVESLTFTYLDETGAPTTALDGIRAVLILLTTGPVGRTGGRVSMVTQVRLRNR